MVTRKIYQQSLPKKRMGAGCLLLNQEGQLLLVNPSYKPTWEIPGGVVEANESPKACCHREVSEEIGLIRDVGRLLVVDYLAETESSTEALMFIFFGGILTPLEITQIHLAPQELLDYRFFTLTTLPPMTDPLRRRVLAAWQQLEQDSAIYLES